MKRGFDYTKSKTEVKKVGQVHEERLRPHQIENMVIAPGQGSLGTQSYASLEEMIKTKGTNEREGGEPQAQENESKLIHAGKIFELRVEVLTAAMRECHMAVATRKRWKEIEASMDDVEIAWDKVKRASWELGNHSVLDLLLLPVEMVQGGFFNWPPPEFAKCWPVSNRF